MLAREVGRHFRERPHDFAFCDLGNVLRSYDFIFANLENPASRRGQRHSIQNPHVAFRCDPASLDALANLGVTAVSLANNHMLDYGGVALTDTLSHLDALGIGHAGAGRDYEEANRPLLLESERGKVAFFSYCFIYSASTRMATRKKAGISDHRMSRVVRRIRELRHRGYIVIVSAHWGLEYSLYPVPYLMTRARRMIDCGASLIIGHGPHFPQGTERYRNGRIVYSLGNFVFDEPQRLSNLSFVYGVELGDRGARGNETLHPVQIRDHVPVLLPPDHPERDFVRGLVDQLGKSYGEKPTSFWKDVNNLWFWDIVWRVRTMRSLKFIFLQPVSFFFGLSLHTLAKRLSFTNLSKALASLSSIWLLRRHPYSRRGSSSSSERSTRQDLVGN